MSTLRQVNLAMNIASGRFLTLKDLLVSAGYSTITAEANPGEIISQKGVQEELVKLGFNELAAKATVSIILFEGMEINRLRAADMIFRVLGLYHPKPYRDDFWRNMMGEIEDNQNPVVTMRNGLPDA
jgi:hypothetical protein